MKGLIPMIEREAAKIIENHSEEDVKSRLQEWAQERLFVSELRIGV